MQSEAEMVEPQRRRWGDPWKWLPVVFVSVTIANLWLMYVVVHLYPMIFQPDVKPDEVDKEVRKRGIIECIAFQVITLLLVICYVKSILISPGEVPDNDPQWEFKATSPAGATANLNLQETKKSGDRRFCKWCQKYKPDRCHHCRVCRVCILKMDHHCPWIYNCVGFQNYKYFFLLLFYSVLDTHLIVWTMAESVHRSVDASTPFVVMFLVLFGETLAFFLGTLVTMFFFFHIYLMLKAMTTIEFCEKSLPKKKEGKETSSGYDSSVYDMGFFGNLKAVLGSNVLLWFLPCSPPSGDGLNFVSEETRLTKDLEASKGIRRLTHRRTQRSASRRTMGTSSYSEDGLGSYYAGQDSHGQLDLAAP